MNPAKFASGAARTLDPRKEIGRLRTEFAWLDMQLVAARQSLQRGPRGRIERLVRSHIQDEEVLLCVKTDVVIPFATAWGVVHEVQQLLPRRARGH